MPEVVRAGAGDVIYSGGYIMRRTSPRKRTSNELTPLSYDIAGILIITLGAISLVSLIAPARDIGEIGRDIARVLRLLSGAGAYIMPLLAFLFGVLLLFGGLRLKFSRRSFAAVALWLLLISWLHVAHLTAPYTADRVFSPAALETGGGFLGASISYLLLVALGRLSTLVLLGGLAVAALLVIVDAPVFSYIVRMGREAVTGRGEDARDAGKGRARQKPAETASGNGRSKSAEVDPFTSPEEEAQAAIDRQQLIERAVRARREALSEDVEEAANQGHVLARKNGKGSSGEDDVDLSGPYNDEGFELPPLSLLDDPPPMPDRSADELNTNVEIIERTLKDFKVNANVVEIAHGPTVTRYEIQLAAGILVNKIKNLADNIAMSLAAINVRVEAPIPGKSAIGLEVPNQHRGLVGLKDVIDLPGLQNHPSKLAFPVGVDVAGEPIVADLAAMPHLLVAGATNMGKSVMLNTLIASLLLRTTPREVRLVLVDPKRVELSLFDGVPHLISPVIRDAKAAAGILRSAVQEMDRRYDRLANAGTRNIQSYNEMSEPQDRMPYLVIVVDELADLMMQSAAEVEASIIRIAQLARAVGIHLVIATQRPSVDVVTGTIKANIASRIAFAVSSQVDSRTVLDQNGAERLIGKGDMLFRPIDAPKPVRIQGPFISEQEVKRLVEHLRAQGKPDYKLTPVDPATTGEGGAPLDDDPAYADEFYQPALEMVVREGKASTSLIQRRFRIGYTRAARLVDAMEKQGVVGPADGANPRDVLVGRDEINNILGMPQAAAAGDQDYYDDEDED